MADKEQYKRIGLEILAKCASKGGIIIVEDPSNPWYKVAEDFVKLDLLKNDKTKCTNTYTLTVMGKGVVDDAIEQMYELIEAIPHRY